jgi:hypothetical protein
VTFGKLFKGGGYDRNYSDYYDRESYMIKNEGRLDEE